MGLLFLSLLLFPFGVSMQIRDNTNFVPTDNWIERLSILFHREVEPALSCFHVPFSSPLSDPTRDHRNCNLSDHIHTQFQLGLIIASHQKDQFDCRLYEGGWVIGLLRGEPFFGYITKDL